MTRPPERLARPTFGSAASGGPSSELMASSADSAACSPEPWLAPIAARLERSQACGRVGCGHARQRLGALVERQRRDDRKRGDAANGLDRGLQLVELVERLDHEQVDAAAVEDRRLLGEDLGTLVGRERVGVAERPDRAGDEDLPARDLARLAGELDPGAVDSLELVLQEELRQFLPVGAERVGLDQVRACADEARVEGLDALGRLQVRLLGAAQTRDCARDEDAHPAVADHDRARGEALFEPAAHAGSTLLRTRFPAGAPARLVSEAAQSTVNEG